MKIPEALKTKKAKETFEAMLFIGLFLSFMHTDSSPAKPMPVIEYIVVGLVAVGVVVLMRFLYKTLWKH